jgi:trans-2-enoyl-CoA reductase
MLAACVNDDDVFRVQTPLTILNQFPPFSRASNKWRPVALPAIAGGEGVGVVVAAAKDVGPADGAGRGLPGLTPKEAEEALEVRDWVVALPDSRGAPLGCWGSLRIYDSARLLKVAPQQLPLQHYACSRSLCTAYRLLEDYGDLRPGDTLIQNGADLPTGQVVIQLCKLLKIRTINLVQDDEGFPRTKEVLDRLGATHVLRDNAKLGEFLGAIGADMPRLALDAHGGDAGRRLAVALRPGGSLVVHSLSSGAAPQLSPSVLLYHQVSLHAFSLAHWTAQPQNGRAGYARMLRSLGDLARAEKLHLFTRAVPVAGLDASKLREALGSHRAVQSGAVFAFRERSVFVFGDEASARDLSFELAEQIRQLEAEETAGDDGLPGGGVVVGAGAREAQMAASGGGAGGGGRGGGGGGGSLARWADAQAMLRELGMEAYVPLFEEEEMTGMQLLRDIAARADGDKELMEAFKEMGIKKMGHRQTIVNAVLGLLP